jgi:4-carboxymuconolactone decarboxylase
MSDIKPRILPLPRAEWTDEAREVFAYWGEPDSWENGSKTNIIMVLANHPALAMAYNAFGKHLLLNSSLAVRPRELVVLRTSWHLKAEYEWHYHVGYALKAGMTLDEIAAIGVGPDAANWNEIDRAVLRAVDQLWKKSNIDDETWACLAKHYDRHEVMDLVFTIGHYVMISWALAALGVQLEDGVDRIGFDLKTASGASPVIRHRPGEVENWTETS